MKRDACIHSGAREDDEERLEALGEMVTVCIGAVIREELQAVKLKFLRQMGITRADVNMR